MKSNINMTSWKFTGILLQRVTSTVPQNYTFLLNIKRASHLYMTNEMSFKNRPSGKDTMQSRLPERRRGGGGGSSQWPFDEDPSHLSQHSTFSQLGTFTTSVTLLVCVCVNRGAESFVSTLVLRPFGLAAFCGCCRRLSVLVLVLHIMRFVIADSKLLGPRGAVRRSSLWRKTKT